MSPTISVQEWRKLNAKKKRARVDRQKETVRPIMMNANSLMLGFDADAKKCGLALYDVKENNVLEFKTLPYNDISTWLDEVVNTYGNSSLYARVEVGDKKTAYGASAKSGRGSAGQKKSFSTVFESGGSAMIAKQFLDLLERREIRYEIINSSSRFNIENRKLPKHLFTSKRKKYVDLSPVDLVKQFVRMPNTFPSKLKADQISAFFQLDRTGNSESRDALSLLIPEYIRFNYVNNEKHKKQN